MTTTSKFILAAVTTFTFIAVANADHQTVRSPKLQAMQPSEPAQAQCCAESDPNLAETRRCQIMVGKLNKSENRVMAQKSESDPDLTRNLVQTGKQQNNQTAKERFQVAPLK